MHEAGHSKQVCWDDPEQVEREVGAFRMGDTCTHGWFMVINGKKNHNIVK